MRPIQLYPFLSGEVMAAFAPHAVRLINAGDFEGLQQQLVAQGIDDFFPDEALRTLAHGYNMWRPEGAQACDPQKLEEAIHAVSYFPAVKATYGKAFRDENPIHDLLSLESELAAPEEISKAYEILEEILKKVSSQALSLPGENKKDLVYDALIAAGIDIDATTGPGLLSRQIGKGPLGEGQYIEIYCAIAYELLPDTSLIGISNRYEHGSLVSSSALEGPVGRGQRIRKWKRSQILSLYLYNRAEQRVRASNYYGAKVDFERSAQLNPDNAERTLERRDEVLSVEHFQKLAALQKDNPIRRRFPYGLLLPSLQTYPLLESFGSLQQGSMTHLTPTGSPLLTLLPVPPPRPINSQIVITWTEIIIKGALDVYPERHQEPQDLHLQGARNLFRQ